MKRHLILVLLIAAVLEPAVTGKTDVIMSPPEMPDYTFDCSIDAEGPLLNYIAERPYKLTLKFTNLVDKPVKLNKFAVDFPDAKDLAIDIKPQQEPKTAEAHGSATAEYTITFPKDAVGKAVLVRGTLDYSMDGKGHFADCHFSAMITSELELTLLPQKVIIGEGTEPQSVGMSLINHTGKPYSGDVTLKPYKGIKTSTTQRKMTVDSYGLDAFVFKVEKDPGTKPGHYAIIVDVGDKISDWIAVDVALPIKKAPGKIDIDGNLGEWKGIEPVKIVVNKMDLNTESTSRVDVGKGWFAYDDANLYAAFEVDDTKHAPSSDQNKVTQGDSIQIAFDPLINGPASPEGGFREDDYEFAFAGTNGGAVVEKLNAPLAKPMGMVKTVAFAFKNAGGKSYYEVAFPWADLAPLTAKTKSYFGMSVLVHMKNGEFNWLATWGGGLVPKVDPRAFMPVVLVQ